VVERPTLTDTTRVFGCQSQPTREGRSRGIKFACVHPSVFVRNGQNGEASGLVPEVLHLVVSEFIPEALDTGSGLPGGGRRELALGVVVGIVAMVPLAFV
jgi:hypothetical protein